jgi:hypothetical protein
MLPCVYGVLVKLPPEGKTLLTAQRRPGSEMEAAAIPLWLRILVMVLRTLFFGALVAVTVRLSSPQSETIWTVYDTPSDLIRVAVGVRSVHVDRGPIFHVSQEGGRI